MADYSLHEVQGFLEHITHFKDKETLETEIRSAAELRRHLLDLETHPGYVYFKAKLVEQLTSRFSEMFSAPNGLDSLVNGPYNSGEIAGIKLAVDLVNILSSTIKETIETQNKVNDEKEMENGEETHG